MSTTDLAAAILGVQSPGSDAKFHMGAVTEWDDATGENTVIINGSEFTDLRIITAGPAINIQEGDTVLVVRVQTQWFVMGKVAAPGASAAMRSVSGFITTDESVTSTSFTDLATVGPTVTTYIGSQGKALVVWSAHLDTDPPPAPGSGYGGGMSFAISGANTQAATGFRSAKFLSNEAGVRITVSASVQVEGLTPGLTTFTAKYRREGTTPGGSVAFYNRSLAVIPF